MPGTGSKTRTDADEAAKSKLAGNRPKRCTESRTLESPAFVDFIRRLRNNTLECDAGGKVLRLKRFISANSGPKVLHAVLDALKENTKVEALYIQNFESGFFDDHLVKLAEVLRLKRIWCLNVGENFRTSLPAWKQFCEDLKETAVAHMYASEHHFIGTDVKHKMKDVIRAIRRADPPVARHSLEVIAECGNMWYNPKLPNWARGMRGGASALLERQRLASADSSMCELTGGVRSEKDPETARAKRAKAERVGSDAARDVASFLASKRTQFRQGKRAIVQTEAGAAHALLERAKRRRQDQSRRERHAAKRRDDEAEVTARKNAGRALEALAEKGDAGLVGWKVRVFWPREKAWFYGCVRSYDAGAGKHVVEYEYGDEQTVGLRGGLEEVGFLRAPRGSASADQRKKPTAEKPTSEPGRRSARTPKPRAESPPVPPGGLRGARGIRAGAAAARAGLGFRV